MPQKVPTLEHTSCGGVKTGPLAGYAELFSSKAACEKVTSLVEVLSHYLPSLVEMADLNVA